MFEIYKNRYVFFTRNVRMINTFLLKYLHYTHDLSGLYKRVPKDLSEICKEISPLFTLLKLFSVAIFRVNGKIISDSPPTL